MDMEVRITELAALAIVALSVMQGAYKGLLLKVYSLVWLILLVVVTLVLTPVILPLIPQEFSAGGGAAFAAAVIVTAIVLHIVARLLKIVDHIPVVNTINRLGGAALGLLMGILILWLILVLLGALQEIEWCRQVSGYIRQSPFLSQLQQIDPLKFFLTN